MSKTWGQVKTEVKSALKTTFWGTIIYGGGLVIIAFGIYLSGAADKLLSLRHSSTITAKSDAGDEASGFLTGVSVQFSLQGESPPDATFWIVDDKDIDRCSGYVQCFHTFDFDPNPDLGQVESFRRVDVFFRDGPTYHVLSKHFTVKNFRVASAKVEGRAISMTVSPPPSSDWILRTVSLGKFESGQFKPPIISNVAVPSLDKSDPSKRHVILEQSLFGKLGVTFGRGFDPEASKGITAYFDYENSAGKKLQTVKDLTSQVKELQNTPESIK
jgi:hypothetical protein